MLNPTAVETPHFFREVGALGTMRNGGAEIFFFHCAQVEPELSGSGLRDTRAERWMDG